MWMRGKGVDAPENETDCSTDQASRYVERSSFGKEKQVTPLTFSHLENCDRNEREVFLLSSMGKTIHTRRSLYTSIAATRSVKSVGRFAEDDSFLVMFDT